jgi:hypothetical protein
MKIKKIVGIETYVLLLLGEAGDSEEFLSVDDAAALLLLLHGAAAPPALHVRQPLHVALYNCLADDGLYTIVLVAYLFFSPENRRY